MATRVVVSSGFDDLRAADVRFLEEASKFGTVDVSVWSDGKIETVTGRRPKFSQAERLYLIQSIRYVADAEIWAGETPFAVGRNPDLWAVAEREDTQATRRFCEQNGVRVQVMPAADLAGFPKAPEPAPVSGRKKVLVTGCYDWLHSGHVRFFEEVSAYGDVYAVVGHDANIRLLKGKSHPLLSQEERRYMVSSVRYVTQALISTGQGWLDAEPEIEVLKPDIYAVNEDGDRGGKRDFCARRGIEYLVLKRVPAPGLPARTSTNLRGF